jgi:WD40 repeat protein
MEDQTNQQAPSTLLTALHAQLSPVVSPDAASLPTETLLADLKAADWRERLAALHLLAERETAVPPAELHALLDDEDMSVRAAAVYLLGRVHEPESVGLALAALDDPAWLVRENALLALGELGAAGLSVPTGQLKKRLDDEQEFVRESAELVLRKTRQEDENRGLSPLSSLARLLKQIRPVDISGEVATNEKELEDHEEAEPVITSLDTARPPRFLLRPSRLSHARRWLTVTSAAVIVFGLIASWLLVLPRLWGTQPAQNQPRVLFRATNLGNLSVPAWATPPKITYVFCSSSIPLGTPQATVTFPPEQCSTPVPVTPTGQAATSASKPYLSFVDDRGGLYVWDSATGKLTRRITLKSGASSGDSSAFWYWLYPGHYIVSYEKASSTQETAKIWDALTGRLLFTTSRTLPFAMTRDGWLAALTSQHTIQVWNVNFPRQQGQPEISSPSFSHLVSLNWSPDGDQLAAVLADGTIQIWEPSSSPGVSVLLQTLHIKRDFMSLNVQWSPDEQRMATTVSDHANNLSIQIWALANGHLLQNLTPFTGLAFLPVTMTWLDNGRAILASDLNQIVLQDTMSGKILLSMPKSNMPFLPLDLTNYLSPDQHWLVLPQSYGIQVVDLRSAKILRTLPNNKSKDYFLTLALSPDNKHFATVDGNSLVQVWNIQTGQVIWTSQLPANFKSAVAMAMVNVKGRIISLSNPVGAAWSPDGKMLAVAYRGGGVVVLGMPGQ